MKGLLGVFVGYFQLLDFLLQFHIAGRFGQGPAIQESQNDKPEEQKYQV